MNKGYIHVIVAIFLVALAPVGISHVLSYDNSETASVIWSFFSFMGSLALAFFTGHLKEALKVMRRHYRVVLPVGLLAGVSVICWFYSISLIGPELSSFLGRSGTIFLVMLSVILLKERFNLMETAGTAISIAGVLLITFSPIDYLGPKVLFIVIGSSLYAISQVVSKRYISRISPIAFTLATTAMVFLVVLMYSIISGRLHVPHAGTVLISMAVPIFSETLSIYLVYLSYKEIGVGKSQTIRSGFPFIVIIYSFILGDGLPLAHQLLGGALIIGGVALLLLGEDKAVQKGKAA